MTSPTLTSDLFEYAQRLGFEGMTTRDMSQLQAACHRVFALMRDGAWHNAQAIIDASGQREGLRRMRELKGIGYQVEQRRSGDRREFQYRLIHPDGRK